VLQAVAMPAVLVETGYISNPEEEDYLNSPTGQTEIAQSIINAIKRYRSSLDNKTISADLNSGK
jgi:N-acetylmuramoyl-L-alanine amidase